jgi:uncharacterized protein (DUF697 family)
MAVGKAQLLNVTRIITAARDEEMRAGKPARLLVAGAGPGFHALALAITEGQAGVGGAVAGALHIGRAGGADVTIRELHDERTILGAGVDDVVVVAAEGLPEATLRRVVKEAHRARAALVVALPVSGVEQAVSTVVDAGALSTELEIFEPSRPMADTRLADAIVKAAGDRATALARSLTWLRHATVARIIRRTAYENAVVGALVIIPGADMPVMTLNQVRMVLRIAAAYGNDVEPARAPEIAAVVGAGLGLRAVAHQGLKLVPAAGWALKGAIGFAGTLALGRAAVAYYESGATGRLGKVNAELPQSFERRLPAPLAARLRDRVGRGHAESPALLPPEPVTPPLTTGSFEAQEEPRERDSSYADRPEDGAPPGG